MSLVKATIKSAIITTLQQPFDEETAASTIRDQYADKLADVIIAAIQSATITIPPSTIVTTGSATTQANATPIVLTNAVS